MSSTSNLIKEYWSQITVFVLFVVSFTTLKIQNEALSQTVIDNQKTNVSEHESLTKEIHQIAKFLNDEDDGVRSDFENADRSIRDYENMRERALKAEVLLEIEKSKK